MSWHQPCWTNRWEFFFQKVDPVDPNTDIHRPSSNSALLCLQSACESCAGVTGFQPAGLLKPDLSYWQGTLVQVLPGFRFSPFGQGLKLSSHSTRCFILWPATFANLFGLKKVCNWATCIWFACCIHVGSWLHNSCFANCILKCILA